MQFLCVFAVSNKWLHERGQEFRRPCTLSELEWQSLGSSPSGCGQGTHLPVYNWLTNTPLHRFTPCFSWGQDKRAFSSLQISPPKVYRQKIPRLTSVTGKNKQKKRTKYRWGPQLTVVLCVVFLSPSSLWAVWAARGCLESSSQDDCLGGLPSKECWIKPIPIPQFPDTRTLLS